MSTNGKTAALARRAAEDLQERIDWDIFRGVLSFVRRGFRGTLLVQVFDGFKVDVSISPGMIRPNAFTQEIGVDDLFARRTLQDAREVGL